MVVFIVGAFSGGALVYLFLAPKIAPPWTQRERRSPPSPQAVVERIAKDLDLDAAQREKMLQILQEADERNRKAFHEIRRDTRERMRAILRPNQLEKFDKFIKEREKRSRGIEHRPGPPR
jgi:uncharacterized membrane protein